MFEIRISWTQSINELLSEDEEFARFVTDSLKRHFQRDWGDLDEEDKKLNDDAFKNGGRLFSAYKNGETKIWIITEADRLVTTVLFPEEY